MPATDGNFCRSHAQHHRRHAPVEEDLTGELSRFFSGRLQPRRPSRPRACVQTLCQRHHRPPRRHLRLPRRTHSALQARRRISVTLQRDLHDMANVTVFVSQNRLRPQLQTPAPASPPAPFAFTILVQAPHRGMMVGHTTSGRRRSTAPACARAPLSSALITRQSSSNSNLRASRFPEPSFRTSRNWGARSSTCTTFRAMSFAGFCQMITIQVLTQTMSVRRPNPAPNFPEFPPPASFAIPAHIPKWK